MPQRSIEKAKHHMVANWQDLESYRNKSLMIFVKEFPDYHDEGAKTQPKLWAAWNGLGSWTGA